MVARSLKVWNSRAADVVPYAMDRNAHRLYVCAYSASDARRVCVELGLHDPGSTEVRKYWSDRWGVQMAGIAPQRGVWISSGYNDTPRRVQP